MTENVNTTTATETATKKRRRSVNAVNDVTRAPFTRKDAREDGLFSAYITGIDVQHVDAKPDGNFPGTAYDMLVIRFASDLNNNMATKHYDHPIYPQVSSPETIPGGEKEYVVTNVLKWVKHIWTQLISRNQRAMTEEEDAALDLDIEDYDEDANGNITYKSLPADMVVLGYSTLFNNIKSMVDGTFYAKEGETPKSFIKNNNGTPVKVHLKLLAATRDRKGAWKNLTKDGSLAATSAPGTGVFELDIPGKLPSISINLAKETLEEVKKAQTTAATPSLPTANYAASPVGNDILGGMNMEMPTF